MDPPQCVQNAMMTKDKKPFTYTPGGIDLSEVRSPRMARRIERNAHLPGSGDNPRPTPHAHQNLDQLPASALAAMRPQPQVQVFPSPPPAMPFKGAGPVPPPPPPMGQGVPPPPPPPMVPLPTQKVKTGDNQVLERPDMTKIIPDNPMTLLRKTGGPQPRKSLVDEMFAQSGKPAPQMSSPMQSQNRYQPSYNEAPVSSVPQQPPSPIYKPQPEQQYQPKKLQQSQPQSPIHPDQRRIQQQPHQPQPQFDQYHPQHHQQQPQYYEPPRQQHSSPEVVREPPRYQPSVIERPMPAAAYQEPQPEVKTSTAHLGSLYIPPVDQQRRIVSPPAPPERNQDSPKIDSPSLREAPKPWQIKKTQQEETPAWAKKENQSTPSPATREQQAWPQSRPTRPNQPDQQQQPIGVRIEIRSQAAPPYQEYPDPEEKKPNAVYVTQPLVLKHPGPQMQVQRERNNQSANQIVNERRGERIIPIQIEGASQATPSAERSFQRQQSNPTQSNKFKIIQKFTNTDEDDTEPSPVTEHSPKFPQNFQQQQVSRGLQHNVNNGPHIRTVPIKMEGNEPQQQYVHPSEQVVPEPKKYTGSSIPGRSFRILQAMTAPDNNCANAIDQNEAFQYDEWEYNRPCLPYPYPPYWHHPNHPYPPSDGESTPRNTPTPVPFAPYWTPPYPYAEPYPTSEAESDSKSTPRNTPIPRNTPTPTPKPVHPPYWGPPIRQCSNKTKKEDNTEMCKSCRNTPNPWYYGYQDYNGGMSEEVPHYFDPYYYYYYYGYPPIYPPYPYYGIDPTDYGKEDDTENDTPTREIIEINASSEDKLKSCEERETPPSSLQCIENIDDDNEDNESDDDLSNDASDEEEDEDESESYMDDDMDNPHQLSVILEESERAESRMRSNSAMSNSTTIAENSEEENDFHDIGVSLPLKLCVTVSEEPNKQVVVEEGNIKTFDDTEMYASFTLRSPSSTPKKCSPCRLDEIPDAVTKKEIFMDEQKQEVETIVSDEGKESDESEDWWGILGEEDDLPVRKTYNSMNLRVIESELSTQQPDIEENNSVTNLPLSELEECCSSKEEIAANGDSIESDEKIIVREEEETTNNRETCEDYSSQNPPGSCFRNSKNIYETDENEEQVTDRKLMQVDDFASQFAQIQENFGSWNLKVLKKLETPKKPAKADISSNSTRLDIHSIESDGSGNKVDTNVVERETSTKIETISRESNGSVNEVDTDVVEEKTSTKSKTISRCSADYTKYNSSKSSELDDTKQQSSHSMNRMYAPIEIDSSDELDSSSDDNEDETTTKSDQFNNNTDEVKVPSIKERIQALKDSIEEKQKKIQENKVEIRITDQVYSETRSKSRSKTTSTKSSVKSLEEFSEEEMDSGVTSDMSRHISDSEEFPELRRLTRYQRAATHSRLFKLLQDECDMEEQQERDAQFSRRNNLTLPLHETDSSISKDFRVTERLINETVQSFLRHKKAHAFRNMADDKLHAAAAKVLEEELELFETPSTDCSSFLSPLRNGTGYSTTVPTPQEFNDEYRQYYESWKNADVTVNSSDCWSLGKNGTVVGSLAKCPRITSPQNIHQKMIKLLEQPQHLPPRTKTNDVTSAS
ncbi:unnamed protein product [Phaedon cochleariae]|uniref:Uncharacterized protein n=1 Tax=Phaedon cochleariae TaxID=80249 RepID=A0A9P0GSM1_PHACE|nr:unnamed protein product [Phaedon cochleariae]